MAEMEEKLGAILNDPNMMRQIMDMAQALGKNQESPKEEPHPPEKLPFDPGMLKQLSGMMQPGNIDRNQQALLQALGPYLAKDRIAKLERAMRAAKIATAASSFISSGGLQLLTGR